LREVLELVGYEYRDQDDGFFEQEIINMISHGHVVLAYQFLHHFGGTLGFTSEYGSDAKSPQQVIQDLAPAAFQQAFQAERWGVAVALRQHFGAKIVINKTLATEQANRWFVWGYMEKYGEAYLFCDEDADNLAISYSSNAGEDLEYLIDDLVAHGRIHTKDICDKFPELATQEERIRALWAERNSKFKELIAEQKEQGKVAMEMAEVTKQPIRLELFDLIQFEKS